MSSEVAAAEISDTKPEQVQIESSEITTENAETPEQVQMESSEMSSENAVTPEQVQMESSEMSTEKAETPEQLEEKARKLLSDGKRHTVCEQFSEAVETFAECCDLFSKRFGEMAFECIDPYMSYANSLLQLERMQPKVVKTAEEDTIEEESEEEEEENCSEKGDEVKEGENVEISEKSNEVEVTGTQPVAVDKEEDTLPTDVKGANTGEASTVEKVEENDLAKDENGTENDNNDDDDGLALAWNMADLARIILEKNCEDNDLLIRLADCRLLLGEIQVANERFEDAVNEFSSCLAIYRDILSPEDRRLSEIYFQIAVALHLDQKYDVAADNFEKAISVLALKKGKLVASLEAGEPDSAEKTDLDEKVKGEIDDIDSLIVDLNQRAADMLESKKQMENKEVMESLQQLKGKEIVGPVGDDKETTDVTHLVRKAAKRPADENEIDDTKKTKTENGVHVETEPLLTNGNHLPVEMEEHNGKVPETVV